MYRLTDRFDEGLVGVKDCLDSTQLIDVLSDINDDIIAGSVMDALERLSDYEDTKLEPEEVIKVEQERDYYHKQAVEIANLLDHKDNDFRKLNQECDHWKAEAKKAMAQLGEYKIAEEQGLLVKLPCKAGNLLWLDTPTGIKSTNVKQIIIDVDGVFVETERFYFDINEVGKSVFISEEAAEQALNETKTLDV